jgi:uncharacterized protein (UPF0276 family)
VSDVGRSLLVDGSVGLSWRSAYAGDLLGAPQALGFVEVIAEACFASGEVAREARALSALWPVVLHSIHLSLGSADGIDDARARRLGRLARDIGAVAVSEHVAFTKAGGREIGHLTPLPRTAEAVAVVADNVARLQRHLDVPLWLENVACPFLWPEDVVASAWSDGAFATAIATATGCPLLLDVANLTANALNAGSDPTDALRDFPLDRVALVHLAGGHVDGDGFYLDTHAHPVPDDVFAALPALGAAVGRVPVVLERDAALPPTATLLEELARARAALDDGATRAGGRSWRVPAPRPARPPAAVATASLAARQALVAAALVDVDLSALDAAVAAGFERAGLQRARRILVAKRAEDALGLLPRLASGGPEVVARARALLLSRPRPARSATLRDARTIAHGLVDDPVLGRDAAADLLVWRARFVDPGEPAPVRPRRGPFLRYDETAPGRRHLVIKGPGYAAPVHFL